MGLLSYLFVAGISSPIPMSSESKDLCLYPRPCQYYSLPRTSNTTTYPISANAMSSGVEAQSQNAYLDFSTSRNLSSAEHIIQEPKLSDPMLRFRCRTWHPSRSGAPVSLHLHLAVPMLYWCSTSFSQQNADHRPYSNSI